MRVHLLNSGVLLKKYLWIFPSDNLPQMILGPWHVSAAQSGISIREITNPDISRVECIYIQGIRAADVVVYLNALITPKVGPLGSPEGW